MSLCHRDSDSSVFKTQNFADRKRAGILRVDVPWKARDLYDFFFFKQKGESVWDSIIFRATGV